MVVASDDAGTLATTDQPGIAGRTRTAPVGPITSSSASPRVSSAYSPNSSRSPSTLSRVFGFRRNRRTPSRRACRLASAASITLWA